MSSVFLTSILKYDRGQDLEIDRDLCIQQWQEMYKPGKMCWNLIKKCVETPETSHDGGPLVSSEGALYVILPYDYQAAAAPTF